MITGIIIANLICWILIFLYLRNSLRKIREDRTGLEPVKEQINQLIVELDQTTERNIQLIETRIEELKKVSHKAGKQVALLQDQKDDYSRALERYRELGRLENPLRNQGEEEQEIKAEEVEPPVEESGRERVLSLFNRGDSLEQISQETGIPQGEIELIISMRKLGR